MTISRARMLGTGLVTGVLVAGLAHLIHYSRHGRLDSDTYWQSIAIFAVLGGLGALLGERQRLWYQRAFFFPLAVPVVAMLVAILLHAEEAAFLMGIACLYLVYPGALVAWLAGAFFIWWDNRRRPRIQGVAW